MTVYGASGAGGAAGVSGDLALNAGGVGAQRQQKQRSGTKQRLDTEAAHGHKHGHKKTTARVAFLFFRLPGESGGADGARTRDPRRDRPVF